METKIEDTLPRSAYVNRFSWPPSKSTRQMVQDRITKNLSVTSILSKKYDLLERLEAEKKGKQIEAEAFSAVNEWYEPLSAVNEWYEIGASNEFYAVHRYIRKCIKLMIGALKRAPIDEAEERKFHLRDKDFGSPYELFQENHFGVKVVWELNKLISEIQNRELQPAEREAPSNENVTCFDISATMADMFDKEEAGYVLHPLAENGDRYTIICFSNRRFTVAAACIADPILRNLKDQLTELGLSNIVSGRDKGKDLTIFGIFSSALEGCALKILDLSGNKLGVKGVNAFASLLKSQKNLEELYCLRNDVSEDVVRAISELIPCPEKLRVLHFHGDAQIGDAGGIAISELLERCPALEDFRCSSANIGPKGGVALASALKKCIKLKKLDLSDNEFIRGPGLGALGETLSLHAKTLVEVDLSSLLLHDDGVTSVAKALKGSAQSLTVLRMAQNHITPENVGTLADCIVFIKCLTKLDLSDNMLKDEGATKIGKALEGLNKIEEVHMTCNFIGKDGALCLARALVDKPDLKLLNIDENCISDVGVVEVKQIFVKSRKKLGRLDRNDPDLVIEA